MENADYSEWVPTGALVKSLFVGVSAYIVILRWHFSSLLNCQLKLLMGLFLLGEFW